MRPIYSALCCYFGKWPTHFQFWLQSCSYNTDVHFFLISDIPTSGYQIPSNVHIVCKSFAEVHELICSKFPEITVSLDRPYKLCDFKPAYGYIFSDLFQGYDYWGFCDIDTIWGNILKFIPENSDCHLLRIFPCGHLCFIRNQAPWDKVFTLVNEVEGTPCRNNMAGKCVSSWQECFSSPLSHYYDEEGGLEPMFEAKEECEGFQNNYVGVDFDNILPPWRFDHFLSINYPAKSDHLVYSYNKGKLFRYYLKGSVLCSEEISYLHASKRNFSIHTSCYSRFVVYPNKISPWREWSFCGLIVHGRKRKLSNIMHRIYKRIFDYL